MKRGVEARDLRHIGVTRPYGADRRQVVRLMQRRKRDERLELREHAIVHAHRGRITVAAMHDAMPDRDQRRIARVAAQPVEQERDRGIVPEGLAGRPDPVLDHVAIPAFDGEARTLVNLFELAARDRFELRRVHRECVKLDAGRACVDDENDVHGVEGSKRRMPAARRDCRRDQLSQTIAESMSGMTWCIAAWLPACRTSASTESVEPNTTAP
ncbi:hypothetical protein DM80_6203 [Burkholderia multivorans]|nr:hypothetical protein DM80_6203 [Burkholderia multivorans]